MALARSASASAAAIILAMIGSEASALSLSEVKQMMIAESVRQYSGSCPCPYNRDRAGRSCGRRSAYSKPGGKSPLCYPEDITSAMAEDYAARRGLSLN